MAIGIRRLGLAIAAVLTAGFSVLLTLSLLIPADTVREQVKAQIHATTGLDPVLSGDVTVSLFPTGSVSFNSVSLSDTQTGKSALTAERLVVRLRFFPFLAGQIEIADVTLVQPTITVAFAPDGSSNWAGHVDTLARALQPNSGRAASFSEIRITDGTVILHDESFKVVERLTNVEFALAWPSIAKSFAATGRFRWHNEPIDATLSLSDFQAALVGGRSGVKVRLAGMPFKIAFDGNLSYRPVLKIDGNVAADAASFRDTMRWAAAWNAPGTGFGRFALKAQASVLGSNVSLSNVNVDLDGNSGEGALTFAGEGRQTLQGTLAVEALDLTPYISTVRLLTGNDWNRRAIALDSFNSLDLDVRLSAARVTLAGVQLGRTAVTANLRGGDLTVAVGESQAFGGIVSGSFGLGQSDSGADMNAQLQFSEVDLDQSLGELIGVRKVEGKGDIGLTIESAGESVYDLTKGLNGTINVVSRKGAINGINIEQLLKRLERNPLSGRGDFRGKTAYDLMTVALKVTSGTANIEEVRLETPSARLTLTGSASIPSRELDMKGVASLAQAGTKDTPPFELPFVVQGPWDDPLIWPDVRALINRSGAAAPLLDAVRNRLKREPSRPSSDQPATSAAPSASAAQ